MLSCSVVNLRPMNVTYNYNINLARQCLTTLMLNFYAPWGHHRHPSSVRPSVRLSVCLMSRTLALIRKPKGLGRRNFAQGYPRSHATPTPTSRSKVKVTGRRHIVASTKRVATWRKGADITSLKYYLILQCL